MDDILDGIKRIKAFEKLFVGLGNDKFIIKDLEKPDEHTTLAFRKNGILDVHKTKEGSEKEYESLGKFDLIKAVKDILADPKSFENALMDFVKGLKEVHFDEPEFEHFTVAIMKSKEELAKLAKKEKKNLSFPIETIADFDFRNSIIPWKEAKNKMNEYALVFDKTLPVGYVWKVNGKFFYMSIDVMANSSVSRLITKMTNPEKLQDS